MKRNPTHLALSSLLLGSVLLSATGCDYLKKKADEQLQEELKKDSKKKLDDAEKDEKSSKDDKPSDGAAADGPVWLDAVSGKKTKLVRVKIDTGGLTGLTILAPEGAEVKASLGGRGADVVQFGVGFAVWVTEDPTATLPLMKEAASAIFGKDSKIAHEDANSIIVGGKSPLGDAFFAYQGIFKANGKIYRCQTESSQAGSTKAHAEAIDKACESLELGGKSIGSGGSAAPAEKVADNGAEPAKTQPDTAAPSGANGSGGQTKPASASTAKPPAAAPTATATATPPAPTAKPAAVPPPPPPPPPAADKKKTRTPKK